MERCCKIQDDFNERKDWIRHRWTLGLDFGVEIKLKSWKFKVNDLLQKEEGVEHKKTGKTKWKELFPNKKRLKFRIQYLLIFWLSDWYNKIINKTLKCIESMEYFLSLLCLTTLKNLFLLNEHKKRRTFVSQLIFPLNKFNNWYFFRYETYHYEKSEWTYLSYCTA